MRRSRTQVEHREAVSRRLALLRAEMEAAVEEPDEPPEPEAHAAPAPGAGGSWGGGAVAAGAAPLPRPGRHADRLGDDWRAGGTPGLLTRFHLGAAQLSVVAVAVAVGLAVTCWWVLRAQPEQLVPDAPGPVPSALVTPLGVGADPTASPTALVVDVAGRVRRPGIAVLDPGSRVVDAIEAAGGARPGVDLSSLNLARALVDGEQILVGVRGTSGSAALLASPGAPSSSRPLVNLNTADQSLLESLPEVGPVTAQAIIGWRDQHGGFTAVDQLLDVDGIGQATLAQLAPLVTV